MIRHPQWAARLGFVAYAAVLATLTHWPRLELTVDNDVVAGGFDKWGHVGAFGLWALLLLTTGWLRGGVWRRVAVGVSVGVAYAIVDEVTQSLMPGRQFSAEDVIASAAGCVLGGLVWRAVLWIDQPTDSFISHAKVMSGLTLVSRVFGLVRDAALAFVFGFGWVFDAYVVAFMIPNLFRRLFGEGALAGAFVPHYTQLDKHDRAAALRFASLVLGRLSQVLLAIAAVGVAATVGLVLAGALDERGELMASLTAVSLWYMPLVCVAAILGAMLQVHGKFAVPSASPILLNLFIIGACLAGSVLPLPGLTVRGRAYIVIGAVVLAGFAQVAWHAGSLRAAGVAVPGGAARRSFGDDPAVADAGRRLLKQWLPTVLGLAVFQVNTLADVLIATFFSAPAGDAGGTFDVAGWTLDYPMAAGSVATLGAAARLYEFPLGVFGIAVASALFPALSRTADEPEQFADLLRRGLRMVVFIGVPAAAGLVLIRHPVTTAIYAEGGRIAAGDSARVAWVLLGYAPAIWAYSMNHTLVRAFYAQRNAITPMRIAVAIVALNVVLNLALIWLPIGGGERLGAAGLAWSTATCAIVQCVVLMLLVRRYVARPIDAVVAGSWLRSLAATVAMAGAVWGVLQLIGAQPATRGEAIIACAVTVIVGALALGGAAVALRMPELKFVLRRGR
jgi:putative peptidoglycan lipid II flippase